MPNSQCCSCKRLHWFCKWSKLCTFILFKMVLFQLCRVSDIGDKLHCAGHCLFVSTSNRLKTKQKTKLYLNTWSNKTDSRCASLSEPDIQDSPWHHPLQGRPACGGSHESGSWTWNEFQLLVFSFIKIWLTTPTSIPPLSPHPSHNYSLQSFPLSQISTWKLATRIYRAGWLKSTAVTVEWDFCPLS